MINFKIKRNDMKWKGFNKLTIQIIGLFAMAIFWNFFTETDFYLNHFMWKSTLDGGECPQGMVYCKGLHYHWNAKGILFFSMGCVLFIVQCMRIIFSHNEKDFTNKT